MEPSVEKLLALLADSGVRFVVVGGVAVALQGFMRFTEDVDILLDSDKANLERLLRALSGYGEGYARELTVDDFTDEEGAIRIIEETEQCQIDIFTRMSGLVYDDLAQDSQTFDMHGRTIVYASKAKLIALKSGSHREKDQLDVMALRRLADS